MSEEIRVSLADGDRYDIRVTRRDDGHCFRAHCTRKTRYEMRYMRYGTTGRFYQNYCGPCFPKRYEYLKP